MDTSKASKECHPTTSLTFLCSWSSRSSGLIFYPISLGYSASAPLASLLFLKHTSGPLHLPFPLPEMLFPRYTQGFLPRFLSWSLLAGTYSVWPVLTTLSYIPVLLFFCQSTFYRTF